MAPLKRKAIGTKYAKPSKRPKSKIEVANTLSSDQFQQSYLHPSLLQSTCDQSDDPHDLDFSFKASSELTPDELTQNLSLIEFTSRHDYENSSLGWHPRHKKREMCESEMRYLLVSCNSVRCKSSLEDDKLSGGFMSFMLTHDSTPSVPVLYIYEIHLADQHQKRGIGRRLMQAAEDIATAVGVRKVMLTCFLSNEKAHGFYQSLGYDMDECSPTDRKIRNKIVKPDYVIMSKEVERSMTRRVDSTRDMASDEPALSDDGSSTDEKT